MGSTRFVLELPVLPSPGRDLVVSVEIDTFGAGSMAQGRIAVDVQLPLLSGSHPNETVVGLFAAGIWSPFALSSSPTSKKDLELSSDPDSELEIPLSLDEIQEVDP